MFDDLRNQYFYVTFELIVTFTKIGQYVHRHYYNLQ